MPDILVFHRLDGREVHVIRANMVEWYKADDAEGTHITEVNGGFRVVKETVEEVDAAYRAQ